MPEIAEQIFDMPVRRGTPRSEEHTSELQSQPNLVCRLLLEKTTPPTAAPARAGGEARAGSGSRCPGEAWGSAVPRCRRACPIPGLDSRCDRWSEPPPAEAAP